ncbi:beta-hexosaminidase subunit beta-like isoform X2 [Episyrphus balteatus]|uniref:beta-hexosaminidase subunit beta-like isoform X2 n=1 Tax=Episyrphus balteatus TaxID=286459 RepID=UPI002484F9B6|nr:beta-hexosaminidase subunit beta-like isoform X2 [Episyrphus balteatus]
MSHREALRILTFYPSQKKPKQTDYVYGHGKVVSNSIWGILRGLETLSQILVPMSNGMLRIPETEIYDKPRFQYRGFMLDTARHFINVSKILQLIDGMAYNKLNVFHWHMTDDSAFPYNSTRFPELSAKGAYNSRMTYSKSDVNQIIEHARERGIRVIPEFDTPAHTASWGASHPEIMTECFGKHNGQLGPFNPTSRQTFNVLDKFFSEIKDLFPDTYIHIGGDEVDSACWESNPDIQQYLKEHGQDSGDLPYMFFEKLTKYLYRNGQTPILWQEVIEENPGIELPQGTMAQVWFNSKKAMPSLTKKGYTTIFSDGFYLYAGDDGPDWMDFYNIEPTNFTGDATQKNRVAGGEACMWTEWVNNNNVMTMVFPRASAVAERLWSKETQKDTDEAAPRMEEHNCRMLWRGIETRPANGYGLC